MTNSELIKKNIQNFQHQHQKKSCFWRLFKIIFFTFLVAVIAVSTFSYKVIFSQDSVLSSLGRLPIIKQFRQLVGMENLKGELDDRINFLLLGQGGVNHEGPYLTDTLIFGSIKPSTHKIALISIPRDLFADIKGYGWHKINEANSIGEINNYPNGGSAFAAKVMEDIFDLPIHYWLRIDFNAFEKTIDDLGGITVCVDRAFEDYNYPTDGFKMQTIVFSVGCQKMTGETALKFVRSRHGTHGEGSDFARAARQQKVILAIKDKIFGLGTLTSPQKVYNLYNTLKNHIQTNIELSEIPYFLKLVQNIKKDDIKRLVLDNSPQGLLRVDISQDSAYILLPRTGDYTELQNLAKNIFIIKNGQEWEPVNVIVLNGTRVEGWARDTAGYLSSLGLNVLKTSNTPFITENTEAPTSGQNGQKQKNTEPERYLYEKTVVYDLKGGERKDIITVLKESLAANVTDIVPEFLKKEIENFGNVNFIIVLGCSKDNPECQEKEKLEIRN